MSATARQAPLDELDRLIKELGPAGLVEEYRDIAAANGVDETQLLAWLADDDLLVPAETARMCGVEVDTLYQWCQELTNAQTTGSPVTDACFIAPNIKKTNVRLWAANRVLLFGWRTGRLQPGTRTPRLRSPQGRPPGVPFQRAA